MSVHVMTILLALSVPSSNAADANPRQDDGVRIEFPDEVGIAPSVKAWPSDIPEPVRIEPVEAGWEMWRRMMALEQYPRLCQASIDAAMMQCRQPTPNQWADMVLVGSLAFIAGAAVGLAMPIVF